MAETFKMMQRSEEDELGRKRAELSALEARLAQRELNLATLQAELRAFERHYLRVVGKRLAEIDQIEAQIARRLASQRPYDRQAQEHSADARARAKESARATGAAQQSKQPNEFKPSDRLRKLYRDLAKRIHPDLTTDPNERARRTVLMAEANRAYEEGNESYLQAILREWDGDLEAAKRDGIEADLIRVNGLIARVKGRLRAIEVEIAKLRASELYQLKMRVDEARRKGQDLLRRMGAELDERIFAARKRLADMKTRYT